jgi:hypothetical protein
MKNVLASIALGLTALVGSTSAELVEVIGGQTNVVLDVGRLAGLGVNITDLIGPVIVPGNLDPTNPGSVAFGINPRDAASLPTTFSYDPSDFLGTFSGTIEHAGAVEFNDALVLGNFSIGFDANRPNLNPAFSGFVVRDNIGFPGVTVFDIGDPMVLTADETALEISGDLLISTECGRLTATQSIPPLWQSLHNRGSGHRSSLDTTNMLPKRRDTAESAWAASGDSLRNNVTSDDGWCATVGSNC